MRDEGKSALIPWYEPSDYEELARPQDGFEGSYDSWRKQVSEVLAALRADGAQVRVIRIVAAEYRHWLDSEGKSDGPEARLAYLARIADLAPRTPET